MKSSGLTPVMLRAAMMGKRNLSHRLQMSPFRISVTRTPHTRKQPYYKSSTIPENTNFEELQKFDDYSYKNIEIRQWDRKN